MNPGGYRGRRVLITGGLGFLGSNLCLSLVEQGAHVTVTDALLPGYGGNLHNIEPVRSAVNLQFADVRDRHAMNQVVQGQDVIFHIAAQTSHVDSMVDPYLDVDINLNGTLNLLEAIRHHAPHARFVYAGTRAQYGKMRSSQVVEEDLPNPTDIYGVNKLAGEYYAMLYSRIYGFPAASLRMTNAYGPRHQMRSAKYGILNWFVRLALEDRVIPIYGDGAQLRDYLYVGDAVGAFLAAGAGNHAAQSIYNVGGNPPVRFVDMARRVVELAGSGRIEFQEWPQDRKAIESGDFATDVSRIRRELGWSPTVPFDEGLRSTIEFYRANKSAYW